MELDISVIPLQEELCESQLEHVLPQENEPRVPIPHVSNFRPLTGWVLKRQVQKGIELLRRVIIPVALGWLQGVPKSLLRIQQVFINPSPVGSVQLRGGQARAQQRERLEGQLRAVEEPFG